MSSATLRAHCRQHMRAGLKLRTLPALALRARQPSDRRDNSRVQNCSC